MELLASSGALHAHIELSLSMRMHSYDCNSCSFLITVVIYVFSLVLYSVNLYQDVWSSVVMYFVLSWYFVHDAMF